MRTFTRLLSLFIAFVLPIALWANVIVKGTVKYVNGLPANNYEVHIQTDSASCVLNHITKTNPNGFYQDSLICNGKIAVVIVWVRDCAGNIIQHQYQAGNSNIIESNFEVCSNNNCVASFFWQRKDSSGLAFQFNSEGSLPESNKDSIISRKWSFGDGTYDSTHINPVHTYSAAGNYNVCLVIKTSGGCTSTICKNIVAEVPCNGCQAYFSSTSSPNIKNAKDLVSYSQACPGDSIKTYTWSFGDGSTIIAGPKVTHEYARTGVYTVCLKIQTVKGCESNFCKQDSIRVDSVPQNNNCRASFSWKKINALSQQFNSAYSVASSNTDSIIKRYWSFGDGTYDSTHIDPVHNYAQPGIYTVCLKIKTKAGCESSICLQDTLRVDSVPQIKCHADFNFNISFTPNNVVSVKFDSHNSQASNNDSIVIRKWSFGDGTSGTGIDPTHTYQKPGNYTVCLYIKSYGGCTDSICKSVTIPSNQCEAAFKWEQVSANSNANGYYVRCNSSESKTSTGDSIISRKWYFGDGQVLEGNVVDPAHKYTYSGTYNVCLVIRTKRGCENKICKNIQLKGNDSTRNKEVVKIISLYPQPVRDVLKAVIYSKNNNVSSDIEIYDVYGVKKWGDKKVLSEGNNTIQIPTGQLAVGPYILRVTTIYGKISSYFFKIN